MATVEQVLQGTAHRGQLGNPVVQVGHMQGSDMLDPAARAALVLPQREQFGDLGMLKPRSRARLMNRSVWTCCPVYWR